jgi:putative transposase
MTMRADATIDLKPEEREELTRLARSRRTPQALALRARIVLKTADGERPSAIAQELAISQPTVRKWRLRFVEDGIAGLRNEPRPGRPRSLDDQKVADLLNKALQTRPAKQTHWSVRSFASEATISKDMAHRLFRAAGIQPHRSTSFKLSNDPAFVEKVRDITGLYLNPPDKALVCSRRRKIGPGCRDSLTLASPCKPKPSAGSRADAWVSRYRRCGSF